MGVDVTFYTVYGIKLESNQEFLDEYYDLDPRDLDVINDGMSGEYMVLGKVLSSLDEFSNIQFKEISLVNLDSLKAQYKSKFKEYFPKYWKLVNKEFKLLCFVHYS